MDQYSIKQPESSRNEFSRVVWNMFYHMFIPERDLFFIQHQAHKLADLATCMNTWSSSVYGAWARFMDEDTRVRVRHMWLQYADTASFTKQQKRNFEKRGRNAISKIYDTRVQDRGLVLSGLRSAGPHATRSASAMSMAFRKYWATGVVGGNKDDVEGLEPGGRGRINPLFAISSASNGDFAVHYGTDPLQGFHLAQAFDILDGLDEIERMVSIAKSQFHEWCNAFVQGLADSCVVVHLYCGDAIRLCYGLQERNPQISQPPAISTVYKDLWNATPLQLLSDETDFFDVIDTSNLLDHVGILNVLPAAVPLLRRSPCSVMYTESLLRASRNPKNSLEQMLCSDVKTMSLLLAISPVPYLTGITVDSHISEYSIFGSRQFRLRVPWRIPLFGDPRFNSVDLSKPSGYIQIPQPTFEPLELAVILFQMYLRIFEYEDWSKTFSFPDPLSIMRQLTSPIAADLRYYTRINLPLLISMIKRNVQTEWDICMAIFLDMIESDTTLMIGPNCLQELRLHMHTFGLSQDLAIQCPPRYLSLPPFEIFGPDCFDTGLLKEADIPSVIFVALVVPRSKLRVFTNESPDTVGTPGMHISITHGTIYQNSFHSIQCFFGKIVKGCESGICTVDEDSSGWRGKSDLIVVCQVPLFTLLLGPRSSLRVSLAVDTSPSTVQFTMKLGLENIVFETGVTDSNRLHFLKRPPQSQVDGECKPASCGQRSPVKRSTPAKVSLDESAQAERISVRADFERYTEASKCLQDGAAVVVVSESPCTVTINISGCQPKVLIYPYPIDGRSLKTRIARLSSWIEVSARLTQPLDPNGYASNPCPIVRDRRGELFSWALPRINLEKAPIIHISHQPDWVKETMNMTFSTREHVRRATVGNYGTDQAPSALKESLLRIFTTFVDVHRESENDEGNGVAILFSRGRDIRDCDTAIIASAIRHDAESGSLVLDAYFIPVHHTPDSPSYDCQGSTDVHILRISRDEEVLWKRFLPATAERCRDWQHRYDCQYNNDEGIPVSLSHGKSPMCSCGEGEMLDQFPDATSYSCVRDRATRIAIPVLFPVPYVEEIPMQNSAFDEITCAFERASLVDNGPTPSNNACANCGVERSGLKRCQRCRKVQYCNHTCQKMHWKHHKKVCSVSRGE